MRSKRRCGASDSDFERIQLVDPPTKASPGAGTARVAEPVPVNASHEFDRFVIGPGNRFAHAAALAVAEAPGEAYNPLYLHGPPGLGKTHLMGAIAGYMRGHHPELTVHYTTAERFTSEFVTALRTHGPERFKQRYRGLDALLIDDVQFLEGKERTEEEFVHTFNALFAAGKQIVMSCDRPPGSLVRLEERLRDRFEWGLTVEIEPPDLRTRVALLWRFASDAVDGLPEPDVLRQIADRRSGQRAPARRRAHSRPRRLLGLRRAARRGCCRPRAGLEAGAQRPRSGLSRRAQRRRDPGRCLLGPRHLRAPSSSPPSARPRVARARHLAMFLARELTPLSLSQIAREFDRDHSTVIHAIRAVGDRNEPGSATAGDIHSVRAVLGETLRAPDPEDRIPTTPGPVHRTDQHALPAPPLRKHTFSTLFHTPDTSDPLERMSWKPMLNPRRKNS